jgi:hypothetical protein
MTQVVRIDKVLELPVSLEPNVMYAVKNAAGDMELALSNEAGSAVITLAASDVPTLISAFTNDSGYQTATDVDARFEALVGTAPANLDTLGEITLQLADDQNAVAALTTVVAGKVDKNNAQDTIGKLRSIPLSSQSGNLVAADNGQVRKLTAGITINASTAFAVGDGTVLYNDTAGNLTVTLTGVTAYIPGTNTAKTSVTLATRGICSVLCVAANTYTLSGNVS